LYCVESVEIVGNTINVKRVLVDNVGNKILDESGKEITKNVTNEKISNIYDIWEFVGGEYTLSRVQNESLDSESESDVESEFGKLEFSEASMEFIA
jgi:hypothetical protein